MSQEIREIRCNMCNKVLFRKVEGNIRNENGTYATNLRTFTVNESNCPFCSVKEAKHE